MVMLESLDSCLTRTASIRFDGTNNTINVGSALTLADDDGIQYHDQSLTEGGLDVNNVNVGTAITVAGPADLNGDLDVSGTSELTHVNVSGTTTATTISATSVDMLMILQLLILPH